MDGRRPASAGAQNPAYRPTHPPPTSLTCADTQAGRLPGTFRAQWPRFARCQARIDSVLARADEPWALPHSSDSTRLRPSCRFEYGLKCLVEGVTGASACFGNQVAVEIHRGRNGFVAEPTRD